MAGLVQTIAPTKEPLTLAEVKRNSNVEDNTFDTLFGSLIIRARTHVEERLNRQLITATWRRSFDWFPSWTIRLPKPPLISITTFAYTDSNGTAQTLTDGTDYQLDTDSEPGLLTPEPGTVWPSTEADRLNALQITYTAGFGADHTSVPASLKQAMLMLIDHWFVNRSATVIGTISKEAEFAVSTLLSHKTMPEYA